MEWDGETVQANVKSISSYVNVSAQLLEQSDLDLPFGTDRIEIPILRDLDESIHPWKYPDKRGWPREFVLFRGLRCAHERLKHLAGYRVRVIHRDDEDREWDF